MGSITIASMHDRNIFDSFCDKFAALHPGLRLGRLEVRGDAVGLKPDLGGMKALWIYRGQGEVLLSKGYRTKEGDGQPLPKEYIPEPIDQDFADTLAFLKSSTALLSASAEGPVRAIVGRNRDGSYVGDYANDLWKLDHTPEPWTGDTAVMEALRSLFLGYRDRGYSVKTVDSYEPIMAGDQLIVAGHESLQVRGTFDCLTIEKSDRITSHISSAMRLRYLRDSSGGCNFDFDPFRRLPLTWYMNLPGERDDGINCFNSHVVNIARETSPTHVHPAAPIGGGAPQCEMYLVLDPRVHDLNPYGRQAFLTVFPDLSDLARFEQYPLEPGSFVYIPAGTGHRGIDVFVNVITVPGFKPHNEYYIDRDIRDATGGSSPFNEDLLDLKNYEWLDDLL